MAIPPGFVWIIRNTPRFLVPPAATYVALRLLRERQQLTLPTWLNVIACILSLPASFILSFFYANFRDARAAAARGAVLAPVAPYKLPGAIDKVGALAKSFTTGYIGEVPNADFKAVGNTMNSRIFWENRIETIEPEYIKAMLATQFNSHAKGESSIDSAKSLLGTGVFNADGETWKFHRSVTRPFFSRDRIGDFDNFEKHADDALAQTKARLKEGHPIDFQDMVSRFTLDSATEFLFGKDVQSLSAGLLYPPNSPLAATSAAKDHPANVFAQAFLESQISTAIRFFYGPAWRLREFWKDEVQKHMDVCNAFIDPIVKDALMRKREAKEKGSGREKGQVSDEDTLLDYLVNVTEDNKLIREETFNIMIAGRDTTACTLTMAVYMLSQHPDVLRRLREEVLAKVGPSQRPTLEDMREMKYTRAFFNEVLRLYPPVPFNARSTISEPVVWPGINGKPPIYVPANTRTPYSVYLMHRRKDLWGPDAEVFDPDRFLDERLHKYLTPNPFIFVPFNAGPRICLGQQFAYNESTFFLVKLLQTFSTIELAEDVQLMPPADWAKAEGRKSVEKIMVRSHLTMYAEGGLWVRMGEANPAETA
ncbi:cytochrome P450 monooxygenase pc-2 [Coniophora puteana RWD-64-598 SS2]|uniref:Cytochrome P450 monooxygenase pc-2 n=1 Tax=Coniophora puteana (strain RWD-64-598) TaxID=741705 RepID=A0A5M3MTR5_CONPW|nr:cytochrome P450 monooxygenase pc-2 [Coniophora puteana RWD-64-598 SS2]EIW81931.1 cytochrome P450 monooxygenase pc-2 [Coniophora puteana RWD-64-598 SS2]